MLFGEYTVTLGSGALSIPFSNYSGQWSYYNKTISSRESLMRFYTFLTSQHHLSDEIQLDAFRNDISNGLFFDSNIPFGYGLGSSGALVAAVFESYCKPKFDDLQYLKTFLACLEGAFHGSSSGLDPLVSYLNQALRIDDTGNIHFENQEGLTSYLFILDTGMSRQTEPLVKYFKDVYLKDHSFFLAIEKLKFHNQESIDAILAQDYSNLWLEMCNISDIQYHYMRKMIPEMYHSLWRKGLDSDYFKLKLCGAGGGGILMGMTLNKEDLLKTCQNYSIAFVK